MPVIATPVGNAYGHISYLVSCPARGVTTAIDPFDIDLTLAIARSHGLTITQIVSTHEHWDHAGRNEALRAATGARVLIPKAAIGVVERFDETLAENATIKVGTSHILHVIETPGHTMTHISLFGEDRGEPFLLCGDTMFGAGVGNCGYGGHVGTLFATMKRLAADLPTNTRLYPGHDYLARNLAFTLSLEPDNAAAATLLDAAAKTLYFTTLEEEKDINLFLRLSSTTLRATLIGISAIKTHASEDIVFATLRGLRDKW